MTVHVHAPPAVSAAIRRWRCPTCDKIRPMTCLTYEWYGPSITCLGCGEVWRDGERMPRPFAPAWRERSKAMARASYRRARDLLREEDS